MFIVDSRRSLTGAASVISDVRSQAVRNGRRPEDIQFFQGLSPVVGGTETEAKAKEAEYLEQFSTEGALAHLSGSIGIDLSAIDLDQPLKSIDTRAMRGMVKGLIESTPDQTQTFRDLIRTRNAGQFLTGSPEQIADALQDWQKAGVDGFNLIYSVTPGTFVDFIEAVVPILQKRGLMQKEYAPGPLREKMFGYGRLPARHLAAGFRRR
jgi:alkanesulfonate monooxygenase SsuD/methylene tetrahydromethanopterin reductase-like flavin-dependent oxidoreductase (luciferase family)